MRIILFFLSVAVTSVLAFTVPGGEPTTSIVGRVFSTEKVGDFGRNKTINWELWKAQVKVERVTGTDTNIADKVVVYYTQDWSTNYVDITGMHVDLPSRLRLGTNQVYEFICHNHTDIRSQFGFGVETDGLRVL